MYTEKSLKERDYWKFTEQTASRFATLWWSLYVAKTCWFITLPRTKNAIVNITKVAEKLISSFWWLAWIWDGIALKMVLLLICDKDKLLFSPFALSELTAVWIWGLIFRLYVLTLDMMQHRSIKRYAIPLIGWNYKKW